MKKGDVNLLSVGLRNIYTSRSPLGKAGSFYESLSPEGLTKIIEKEKFIQDFLNSLVPRKTILVISEISGSNLIWKDYIFIEVTNIEERLISVKERSITDKLYHVSAYKYGNSLFTLDEYNKFVV